MCDKYSATLLEHTEHLATTSKDKAGLLNLDDILFDVLNERNVVDADKERDFK